MRLLKTPSHTSERPGHEARKNAKKVIEGIAVTLRRQIPVKNLPRTASVVGGRDEKGAMARPTIVKTLPRTVNVAEGGRDEERRIEEHRREDKGNQHQNPPASYNRGGGTRQKAKTNTKGIVAQPPVPRGGRSA